MNKNYLLPISSIIIKTLLREIVKSTDSVIPKLIHNKPIEILITTLLVLSPKEMIESF